MSPHLESYEVKLINVDIGNSKIYSIIAYVTISNTTH